MTITLETPPLLLNVSGFPEGQIDPQDGLPITAEEALAGLAGALGLDEGRLSSGYIANRPEPQGGLFIAAVHESPNGFRRDVEIVINEDNRPMSERAISWFGAHAVDFNLRTYQKRKQSER